MTNTTFPIRIRVQPHALAAFRDSEEGSWHDEGATPDCIDPETGALHVHNLLGRHKASIEVRDAAEAETVYIAACSGTWQTRWSALERRYGSGDGYGYYETAHRICDLLRPHVSPQTQAVWPCPTGV